MYIKNIQIQSIDDLRNTNPLFKFIVPKKFKDTINIESSDEETTLKSLYVKAENPIFLYSGGPNDFFTFIQAGPFELTDEKVRAKLPKDLTPLIEQCIANVEENWKLLYRLNPKVRIYSLSYYYAPLYTFFQKVIFLQEKKKDKSKKFVNRYLEVIEEYNTLLEQACNKYDFVDYCDITFLKKYCAPMDFHPNTTGNALIADDLLKKIKLQLSNQFFNKEQPEDINPRGR